MPVSAHVVVVLVVVIAVMVCGEGGGEERVRKFVYFARVRGGKATFFFVPVFCGGRSSTIYPC